MNKNIIADVIKKHKLKVLDFDNYTNEIAKITKIDPNLSEKGKLIIVTAMNPTPAGEGKTTTSIGLVDVLNKHKVKTIGALREPSLGPVFGMKGTGSGSNNAILYPFDKINLHFTGDLHAIAAANNLIAAVIENELYQCSSLNIDKNRILWKRCLDINDRSLRDITLHLKPGLDLNTSFNITAASDLMALFCLCNSKQDFKEKISRTIVAYSTDDKPITINDLKITDAIMTIISDALDPNLVRTKENNPVFVHGGPFANIAHGCSSLISIKMALKLADVVVTEGGFGSDLGLEKFMNITCVEGNLKPNLVCLTISLKSIIFHDNNEHTNETDQIDNGFKNVLHHVNHAKQYNVPVLVVINHRQEDKPESLIYLINKLNEANIEFTLSNCWAEGSKDSDDMFNKVMELLNKESNYTPLFSKDLNVLEKIETISKQVYGANKVVFENNTLEELKAIKDNKYVCIAKNPYSLTCDAKRLNKPDYYETVITSIEYNDSANLVIPITSTIYRMPGLPKEPKAKDFKF